MQRLEKYDEAIECYNQVLLIVPESVDFLILTLQCKRTCLSYLERFDEAFECNERILAINPNFEDAIDYQEYHYEDIQEPDDSEPLCYD